MAEECPLKLGFVCCSGGGLIEALSGIEASGDWPYSIGGVLTDRACDAEEIAMTHDLPHQRIVEADHDQWSRQAANIFRGWNVDLVVLLFLRRVGPALWRDHPASIWNLHPSLLPAYPGLGALRDNIEAASRDTTLSMGLTMHIASETLDAGPVLAQARFDVTQTPTLEHASHLSFLLKIMLTLEGIQRLVKDELVEIEQENIDTLSWDGSFRGMTPSPRAIIAAETFAQPWAKPILEDIAGVRRS